MLFIIIYIYDIDLKQFPNIKNEKQIGFVFPIYTWGIPEPMILFAKRLLKNKVFTFGVCTCVKDADLAMKLFSKIYPFENEISPTYYMGLILFIYLLVLYLFHIFYLHLL